MSLSGGSVVNKAAAEPGLPHLGGMDLIGRNGEEVAAPRMMRSAPLAKFSGIVLVLSR
jgi:hypothetical protein